MENKVKKILIIAIVGLAVVSLVFMFVLNSNNNGEQNETANNQNNNNTQETTDSGIPEANAVTNEITANMVVKQEFKCSLDSFNKLEIVFNKYYEYDDDDTDSPMLTIELYNGNDLLMNKIIDVREIPNQHRLHIETSKNIGGLKNKELTLKITNDFDNDTGCTLMYQENKKTSFKFGDNKINGTICFALVNE